MSEQVKKWEYKILAFDDYDCSLHDPDQEPVQYTGLSLLGLDGWELVTIAPHQLVDECLPWAIFKRPLKGGQNG